MGWFELLAICASAFVAVFVLLTLLALVMRGLMFVFPEREAAVDAAVIAAITAASAAAYPGTKITRIEELK
jgi:hypothetical protein